ncbi:MAG TPA: hypothetical protein VH600_16760 [Burkholderiales bacterium]|jgi:hypothetical protein
MMRRKFLFWTVAVLILAPLTYFLVVFNWSYADGEHAGWVQKFSSKGWLCKTWEGEMAMVSLPGSTPEKFYFTVMDDKVADEVAKAIGKRVSLHYEQKVGIPTSCFGETRYYVKGVEVVHEIPVLPGVVMPTGDPTAQPAQAQPPASPAPAQK